MWETERFWGLRQNVFGGLLFCLPLHPLSLWKNWFLRAGNCLLAKSSGKWGQPKGILDEGQRGGIGSKCVGRPERDATERFLVSWNRSCWKEERCSHKGQKVKLGVSLQFPLWFCSVLPRNKQSLPARNNQNSFPHRFLQLIDGLLVVHWMHACLLCWLGEASRCYQNRHDFSLASPGIDSACCHWLLQQVHPLSGELVASDTDLYVISGSSFPESLSKLCY